MSQVKGLFFAGLVLIGLSGSAVAEQGCAAGFAPNPAPTGTPGANQCMPIPGYGGTGPSSGPPPPQWAKRWGAIAYDPVTGKVGTSSDMTSQRKAVKGALDHCKSKGGTSCAIQIDYSNQCAAIVYGGDGDEIQSATASAASPREAEEVALNNCQRSAGVQCKVFYAGCSYPAKVR
ncbi:DUF4189 domain-containing protein [Lysobacter enzymogenes]|uniref:DUF4189 domain-containing protein n=1 Tax=Lysobacter enzymogenes TaxID=69 RepID=UPI00384C67F4